jgi:hypothetical protein
MRVRMPLSIAMINDLLNAVTLPETARQSCGFSCFSQLLHYPKNKKMTPLPLAVYLTTFTLLALLHWADVAAAQFQQDFDPQRIPSTSGTGTTQAYF